MNNIENIQREIKKIQIKLINLSFTKIKNRSKIYNGLLNTLKFAEQDLHDFKKNN